MATYHHEILAAESDLKSLKENYVRRFGWRITCNTPGAYWLWVRDFKKEDRAALRRWKRGKPRPLGKPSKPEPYGVITGDLDFAVSVTVRALDPQKELAGMESD